MDVVKRREAQTAVNHLISSLAAADDDDSSDSSLAAVISDLRVLSKQDPDIRAPLADAGAIPLLARCLALDNLPDAQENAAAALLNLSISTREALMSTPGILDALTAALGLPAAAAQHAAATLYSLLSVEAYRPIIGAKRNLIAALVALLRRPHTRTVKDALKALFGIALYPLNRSAVIELGAAMILFSIVVKDGRAGVVEDATAVIAQVAGCYESVDGFRRVAGVRVLVDLVDRGNGASGRSRENAAAALLNLAMFGGEKAVGDIREVEGAEEAIQELAGNGSGRAKSKAEALMRILDAGRGRQHHHHHHHRFEGGFETSSSSYSFSSDHDSREHA